MIFIEQELEYLRKRNKELEDELNSIRSVINYAVYKDTSDRSFTVTISVGSFIGAESHSVLSALRYQYKEFDKWCKELSTAQNKIAELQQDLQDAKRLIKELVEVGRFYGDRANWFYNYGLYLNEFKSIAEIDSEPFQDHEKLIPKHYGGKTARFCLSKNQDAIKKFREGV